jgi:RND family efflux transporter MFP subunit
MKIHSTLILIIPIILLACHDHSHESEAIHAHDEETKFQYTAYSDDFELFAEADAFLVGETANVLSHFSILPGFKAVESGEITLILGINGEEVRQTLDRPTRKGIYSFDIKPSVEGKGTLSFEIMNDSGRFVITIPEVTVFHSKDEARSAAEKATLSMTNTTVFTKEQSWKIEFATGFPTSGPFGQIIKTSAIIQSAPEEEMMITGRAAGIITYQGLTLPEGDPVSEGQRLFTVSASELADNNLAVRYQEALNNYERLKLEYERKQELAKDKIVSEKELLTIRNEYENAKAQYDLLNKHFSLGGYSVISPMSGYIKRVYVDNGQFIEAGQNLASVIKNKTLVLKAEVQQKHASILGSIVSANIRTVQDNKTYSLEELNGKILSHGRSANEGNFLIPVSIQIENPGGFISGSIVELYLITLTNKQAISVPNSALVEDQGNFFVYVQVTPELFEKREVETGATDGLNTEITKGLASGERLITSGAIFVRLAQATGSLDAHSGHNH